MDVEKIWCSTFKMINCYHNLRDVFESICSDGESHDSLSNKYVTEEECFQLHKIASFLEPSAEATEVASASTNVSVSLQPRIFKKLFTYCKDFIARSGISTTMKEGAIMFREKLTKYEMHMASPFL